MVLVFVIVALQMEEPNFHFQLVLPCIKGKTKWLGSETYKLETGSREKVRKTPLISYLRVWS